MTKPLALDEIQRTHLKNLYGSSQALRDVLIEIGDQPNSYDPHGHAEPSEGRVFLSRLYLDKGANALSFMTMNTDERVDKIMKLYRWDDL